MIAKQSEPGLARIKGFSGFLFAALNGFLRVLHAKSCKSQNPENPGSDKCIRCGIHITFSFAPTQAAA
jgi:hypothetical protein